MEIETESTQAQVETQIKNMATSAFANHLIKGEASNTWLCHRSDSVKYSFRVVFIPNYVLLCGDIAPQMFFCRSADSLGWLLSSASNAEALFEAPQIDQKCFYVTDALLVCEEQEKEEIKLENPERAQCWKSLKLKFFHGLTQGEDPMDAWICAAHAVFHEAKDDVGVGPGSDMLWQQQALFTFVRLYQQKQREIPVSRL